LASVVIRLEVHNVTFAIALIMFDVKNDVVNIKPYDSTGQSNVNTKPNDINDKSNAVNIKPTDSTGSVVNIKPNDTVKNATLARAVSRFDVHNITLTSGVIRFDVNNAASAVSRFDVHSITFVIDVNIRTALAKVTLRTSNLMIVMTKVTL
jgi:hypothetical protein